MMSPRKLRSAAQSLAAISPINLPEFMSHKAATGDNKSLMTHAYRYLTVTLEQQQLTVTLNRPDKKNALSFAMMRELIDVANRLKTNKYIRTVIITGAGDAFCTGIDLTDLNNPKNTAIAIWELLKPAQSLFQKVCLIWRDVPMPIIVVMQGYCLGAGLQLALAADIRIAHPDCQLAIMEAKWGLVPDMGLTQSALQQVAPDVLKELAMSARMISAVQAKPLGLVTHLDDDPYRLAQQLAEEFTARSPDAVLASKRIINKMTQQTFATLYQEKIWQIKLMLGHNRKLSLKKAKEVGTEFLKRQFD